MRKRGFTLVELMVGTMIMGLAMMGLMGMMLTGLRSFERTTTDVNLGQPNAQALRRITETIREAMDVTVTNNGNTLTYRLPALGGTDPVTGEQEFVSPPTWDGVTRTFTVASGNLQNNPGGRILLRGIATTDPEPTSTQFNQVYAPFQLTTIGARRAITITLITSSVVNGRTRYARMKTTVLIRNV